MTRPLTRIATLALAIGLPQASPAQDVALEPLLVVYGPQANSREGDPDRIERLFFSLPAGVTGPLYLRLFDGDTGGKWDSTLGRLNGETGYRLFGGEGAFSTAPRPVPVAYGDQPAAYDPAVQTAGTGQLLHEARIAADQASEDQWQTLTAFDATAGEVVGDRVWFRLDVAGVAGDDGNAFAATISQNADANTTPQGLVVVSYAPTLRWPGSGLPTKVTLDVPADGQVTVQNFDAAAGQLQLVTDYEDFPFLASAQDRWSVQTLRIPDPVAAVTVVKGFEKPNDVTISAFASDGAALPLRMPPTRAEPIDRPLPVARAQPLSTCTSVAFDANQSSGADQLGYVWDFGDGQTSTDPVIAHTYATPGRYEAVLSIRDLRSPAPRGARLRLPVHVRPAPIAAPGQPITVAPGDPVAFSGAASVASDSPILRYGWTFGDGAVATGVEASHVYAASGLYRAVLRVEDDSLHPCNFGIATREVRVNHPPVAEAGTDQTSVVGGEVRVDAAASYDRDGTITDWTWDMGDGTALQGVSARHAYDAPGVYTVTLTATDSSGVSNATARDSLTVIVNAPTQPVAAGPARPIAVGEVALLTAAGSVDPDGEILSWRWDFGDGAVAEGPDVQYAWTKPGVFAVVLTTTDNSGTPSAQTSTSFNVVVSAAPVAEAGPDQAVTASVVSFDGGGSTDADGAISSWAWAFGDGQTGTGRTVEHAYAAPGTYEVKLTVVDDSGAPLNVDDDRMLVTINATPVADAGQDIVAAPGQSVTLDATGSIDPDGAIREALWTFPDSTVQTGERIETSFDTPGLYRIALEVRDDFATGSASDFDEVLIRVNAPPVAVIGADLLVEPGVPVIFSGLNSYDPDGVLGTWRWDFDDMDGPMEVAAFARSFDVPGVVTVQLTVIDASGALNATDRTAISVRVNHAPVAEAGPEISTDTLFVDFDDGGSTDGDGDALSYTWDFGDGSAPQTGKTQRHAFPRSGRYPVTLTVNDGSGLGNATAIDATVVVIDAAPLAVAGGNREVCSGFPILFDAAQSNDPDGGRLRYAWDFGDGTVSEIVNPNKTYERPGSYPVTLTVRDESGGAPGVAVDRIAAIVREGPIADAGPDLQACANQTVRFDGSNSTDADGAVNAYAWTFGEGSSASGELPTHIFKEPGTYTVNLTITGDSNALCSPLDSDQMVAEVFPAPGVEIVGAARVSAGIPSRFEAEVTADFGANAAQIDWDFGDGTTAQGLDVEHSFAAPGDYLVTVKAMFPQAIRACQDLTVQRKIVVNAAPTAVITGPTLVAVGEAVTYDASTSADPDGALTGFAWDFGDGRAATGVSAPHVFDAPGVYTVALTVTDDAGTANSRVTVTQEVTVNPTPLAGLVAPGPLCIGQAAPWQADVGPDVTAVWRFGDADEVTGPEVAHAFAAPGLFPVTLRLDDGRALPNSRRSEEVYARVNRPPLALAGPDRTVCPGDTVMFDGAGSGDLDGSITAWRWEFDDGVVLEGPLVERTFDAAGKVGVTLTVTDDSGATACAASTDTALVRVNGSPVADAGPDRSVFVGAAHDAVLFASPAATDPDGDGVVTIWTLGDGREATGGTISHVYAEPGVFDVTVTVADATGLACGVATDTAQITALARE